MVFIRKELAHSVNLRNTPAITFIMDQSIEYGVNMSKMISEVNKDLKEEDEDDQPEGLETGGLEEVPDEEESEDEDFEENEK